MDGRAYKLDRHILLRILRLSRIYARALRVGACCDGVGFSTLV